MSGTTPPIPRSVTVKQFRNGVWGTPEDVISHEIPITLQCPDQSTKKLWAWPDALEDVVIGHALLDLGWQGNRLTVASEDYRHFVLSAKKLPSKTFAPNPGSLSGVQVMQAMTEFMGAEGLWDGTGCFHRAGIYNAHTLTQVRRAEDIGRHNCVDRLAGWAHQTDLDLSQHVLLISARITASLCAKILRAGFRFLVSRSAVTTAAVDMAKEHNATLVGFARDKESRFSIFVDDTNRITE